MIEQNQKIQNLKDKYKGRTCLLLSCGPSLNDYEVQTLKNFAKSKNAIAGSVKQTILYSDKTGSISDVVDIHWFNCANLPVPKNEKHYNYEKIGCSPLVIASSNYDRNFRVAKDQYIDIFFRVPITGRFICFDKDFETNDFDKPIKKPWPGIMMETVFPSLYWMGFTEVITCGWDQRFEVVDYSIRKYTHFYRDEYLYHNVNNWEIEETNKASRELYYHYLNKGMTIKILGESAQYSGIERIEI